MKRILLSFIIGIIASTTFADNTIYTTFVGTTTSGTWWVPNVKIVLPANIQEPTIPDIVTPVESGTATITIPDTVLGNAAIISNTMFKHKVSNFEEVVKTIKGYKEQGYTNFIITSSDDKNWEISIQY